MKITLLGRHPSPAEHIVFPEGIPTDSLPYYEKMRVNCIDWIWEHYNHNEDAVVELYVEGFTPLTIAFVMAWESFYLSDKHTLFLMHHQPDGTYRAQEWHRCL